MKKLKLYFTSDVHGYLFPTDYRDREYKNMGLLNITNSFQKDENTIIIDGGDTIQGSPFTTYLSKQNYHIHPLCQVINQAEYDYIVLGNHDFNYGYKYLMSYLINLNAKVITANVIDKPHNNLILPYDIKTLANGLTVGIIGVTTDYINIWEKAENLTNFEVLDTYYTLSKYYNKVRPQVDILIGVYHGGFENDLESNKKLSDTSENIAYRICEVFDIDVLLTGHQHMEVIGRYINNTYIAQPPSNGVKYIEINIEYENGNITNINGELKTPDVVKNIAVTDELENIEIKVQEWLERPVGYLDTKLKPNTHLNRAINGSLLANFFNQIQLDISGADIACTSLANSVKGFTEQVSVGDIVSTYVYPNTIVVKEITGVILKCALERCAAYFDYNKGDVKISESFLKPKLEHYNYDFYSGIEYRFDLKKEIGHRVTSIRFKGQEVLPKDKLTLAMNNYRASGTGGYEFFRDLKITKDIQVDMTELIINYFIEHKHVVVDKTKYLFISSN